MQQAATGTESTIAVLSPAFLTSAYTEAEWTSAFAGDPTGDNRGLILVRLKEVEPSGLLKSRLYIDLVGPKENEALERLLKQVKGERAKPDRPPKFPGTVGILDTLRPHFPAALPPIWNIPQRRNPNFTGRKEVLSKLADDLNSGQPAALTPTLQKPEGFRVKATEGEVVVLYFEPSATQNLKSSGFPAG
jgi:hypothetical protein